MLIGRNASGLVFAAFIAACALWDVFTRFHVFPLLIFVSAVVASLEMMRLMDATGAKPWRLGALAFTVAFVFDGWLGGLTHTGLFTAVAVITTLVWAMTRPVSGAMNAVGATLISSLWIGLGFASILALWSWNGPFDDTPSREGRYLVIFLLPVAMIQDITAMWTGAWIGRRKLAPTLSPNKTVEGSVGGLIGSVVVALAVWLIYWFFVSEERGVPLREFFTWWDALALGAILGVVGQLGDIAESLLKREAGVKDSGSTGTAHGGVLDVVDSLLFCAPAMILWGWARGLWMFS